MLFSACQVVLQTWVQTKETLIKTVAIETLGYLSFVTSPEAFEQQLPELLNLFDPLGKQQNLPQIATLRGLRLLLEVNPKLIGKPRARDIFLKLFNLIQACGFATDVAKARSVRESVLRAARPLSEWYLDVIDPVLQEKLAGRREERLAVPGYRFWSQNISISILISPRVKISKYRQNIKIRMSFDILNFI